MPLSAGQIRASVIRLFDNNDAACLSEFTVKTGRRMDVICLGADGIISAVEIKSSVADFKSDHKWQDYLEWADEFYFAVADDFPIEILPSSDLSGLILSDGFDAWFHTQPPMQKLASARRTSLTRQIARRAMRRATSLAGQDDALLAAQHAPSDRTNG